MGEIMTFRSAAARQIGRAIIGFEQVLDLSAVAKRGTKRSIQRPEVASHDALDGMSPEARKQCGHEEV